MTRRSIQVLLLAGGLALTAPSAQSAPDSAPRAGPGSPSAPAAPPRPRPPLAPGWRDAMPAPSCLVRRPSGGGCGAWRWTVNAPVWVPIVRGSLASGSVRVDAGARSRSTPVDWVGEADLARTATELEFVFVGGLEVGKGRWSVGAEAEHASLGGSLDWKVSDAHIDGSLSATIARAWVRYEAGRHEGGPSGWCLSWGPTAGVRLYAVGFEARGEALDVDRSRTWIDPTLGLDASLRTPGRTTLRFAGDLGGVATGSNLSWYALAELRVPLARRWSISLGWAWHGIDFHAGRGNDRFDLDILLTGPRLALAVEL